MIKQVRVKKNCTISGIVFIKDEIYKCRTISGFSNKNLVKYSIDALTTGICLAIGLSKKVFEENFTVVEVDLVNNPPHYKDGGIETADFINAKGLNWELGNAVKYISRAGKKDPAKDVEDLEKAIWYINRQIKHLKDGRQTAG